MYVCAGTEERKRKSRRIFLSSSLLLLFLSSFPLLTFSSSVFARPALAGWPDQRHHGPCPRSRRHPPPFTPLTTASQLLHYLERSPIHNAAVSHTHFSSYLPHTVTTCPASHSTPRPLPGLTLLCTPEQHHSRPQLARSDHHFLVAFPVQNIILVTVDAHSSPPYCRIQRCTLLLTPNHRPLPAPSRPDSLS